MDGVRRGADRGDEGHALHPHRRRQHRRAAQAVTDEDPRGADPRAEVVGGRHEILHVAAEALVGEVALAAAEAREVEPQGRDAASRQGPADARRGVDMHAAGEAVGEERDPAGLLLGKLEPRRQRLAAPVRELQPLRPHGGRSP
jgi:hypothetical protein